MSDIIIVGCGKVGHTLTEQLVREGHDITIVDTNERVVRDTTDAFDVMGIQGNGASLSVLMEAGLEEADLVIAVTGSDELNLLCCTIAKKAGGELAAIARVRNPDYSEELSYLRQQLGLTSDDLDDISGFARDIEGVEIGAMLRQQPDGSTKLSVRSSPAFDACAICAKLGGGGHKAAAGASLPLPPDHAQAALLQAIYDVYPSLLPQ